MGKCNAREKSKIRIEGMFETKQQAVWLKDLRINNFGLLHFLKLK